MLSPIAAWIAITGTLAWTPVLIAGAVFFWVGGFDIIVNNAGSFLIAALEETSDSLLREQLAINVEAPFAVARHFMPAMRERGSGQHLLVGSVADLKAYPGNSAYSASKFGVRGLHEVLLEEYVGTGVRCSLVSPGPTDTAVWDPFSPDERDDLPSRSRMLSAEDVAEAIVWTLSRPPHVHVSSIRLGPA